MKRVLGTAEMRAADQASAEHGMPASVLMENAGRALADTAAKLAAPVQGRFFVCCGSGNNGGDGFVAARTLHAQGRTVFVECTVLPDALEGEAHRACKAHRLPQVSIPIVRPELTVFNLLDIDCRVHRHLGAP